MTRARRNSTVALTLLALLLLGTLAALRGSHVSAAVASVRAAEWHWIAFGLVAFAGAFACTVAAWGAAFSAAGAEICPRQLAARIGVGALVNALAPAKLGDAVKVALCSRALRSPDRLWTAGGVYAALAATRSLALAALVGAAFAAGAMPLWPVLALVSIAAVVGLLATVSPSVRRRARLARLIDGLTALLRSPKALARALAWSGAMETSRLFATAAVAAALNVPHPMLAALVILPALDVASIFPLTPGGVGIGSGAVAVVLSSRGIAVGPALGVGLAVQATETLVSLGAGCCGLLYLAGSRPVVRAWSVRLAAVGVAVALAAYLGAVALDLV
jgi:uncharacterized membrane protein YbhN (UPF0104 family)